MTIGSCVCTDLPTSVMYNEAIIKNIKLYILVAPGSQNQERLVLQWRQP